MLAPSPEAVSKFPDRPDAARRSLQREAQATAIPTGGHGHVSGCARRGRLEAPLSDGRYRRQPWREPFDLFSARGELWTTTITSLPRWSIIVWSILLEARGESKQCPSPFTIFGIAVLFCECPANENTSVDWPMHSGIRWATITPGLTRSTGKSVVIRHCIASVGIIRREKECTQDTQDGTAA
jgi:hypothetical protein